MPASATYAHHDAIMRTLEFPLCGVSGPRPSTSASLTGMRLVATTFGLVFPVTLVQDIACADQAYMLQELAEYVGSLMSGLVEMVSQFPRGQRHKLTVTALHDTWLTVPVHRGAPLRVLWQLRSSMNGLVEVLY